jgi:hypothetical protein
MSKMTNVMLDIEMMIEEGTHPVTIAKMLDIPITWVYDTLEQMEPNEEELSPFSTMNS